MKRTSLYAVFLVSLTGIPVTAGQLSAFDTDRAVAERGAFGGTGNDSDVLHELVGLTDA